MTDNKTNNNKKKQKRIVIPRNYPLPYPSDFSHHKEIIKAYTVLSKKGKKPVNWRDFKDEVKFNPKSIVSGNNKFFEYLGLIKKVKVKDCRGCYIPTTIGMELAESLRWNYENEAKKLIRKILFDSWFFKSVKELLKTREAVTLDTLLNKLGHDAGAEPKQYIKKSLKILVDYLKFAELIKEEDGKYFLVENENTIEKSLEEKIKQKNNQSTGSENVVEISKIPNIRLVF